MFSRLTGFLKSTFQDRFKRYLIISLVILGIVFAVVDQQVPEPIPDDGFVVHFFYVTGCPGCAQQKTFNEGLAARHPDITIVEHDALRDSEYKLLVQELEKRGVDDEPLFPVTIFGNQVFMGWESDEETGWAIEEALKQCLDGECPPPTVRDPDEGIDLRWFGRIVFAEHSLATLAVILGLVDGFNPCALWVLIYLISLVATLRDKKKIWLIVGSFVLASGVIYFLLMTAWLNLFLFIGFVRPVTVIIGLVALGGGILQTRDFMKSRGESRMRCHERGVPGQDDGQDAEDRLLTDNHRHHTGNHRPRLCRELHRVRLFGSDPHGLHPGARH
jgi:hypothetical protein